MIERIVSMAILQNALVKTRLALFATILLLTACGQSNAPGRVTKPPNLLLILVDDLGYHDLGFMGNHSVETPQIDAFFAQNTVFMRNYVDASCAPARAGFMTGRPPSTLGFAAVGIGIPEDVPTVPELLKTSGYRTEHIGKWHLGWEIPDVWPLSKGFDYFYGFLYGTGSSSLGLSIPPSMTHFDPWLMENNDKPVKRKGNLTELLTAKAIERIGILARQEKPWMMNLWYFNPHAPLQPVRKFLKDDSEAGKYKAMLAQLDFSVGRVLAALAESGSVDNTIVVFVSDNGGTNRQFDNNFPLTGAKTGYFEGGLRTPMAILIPGLTRPQRIETAVSNLDVAKTFLAAGGVSDDSELPGRDLRPLIAGQSIEQKSLYWEYRHRKRGYIFGIMSADGRWRYGQDPSLGEALYDIEADPAGRINLVKSEAHQDILADLLVDYRNWHDAHRLLFYGTVGEQPVLVSKRGMQRTPGFDSVTWGFAVRPLSATEDEILLNQPGVGSIHMNQTMAQVKLFGYSLHATWNHEANCQTILLATDTISPGVFHKDYHFTADLYVNGKKADSLILRQKLSKQQNHEAMRVFPANGVVQAYLVWGEYVVEKDSLANPGVERIIKRLCPESS